MPSWLPQRPWPIAVDIGSDSVRMLQLRKLNGTVAATAAARFVFPAAAASDARHRRELAIEAISDMLRTSPFRGRDCVSALPVRLLQIKNVRLPRMTAAELEQAILYEARERFDFDIEPWQLGFIDAGEVRTGGDVRDEVIMLAAGAEVIEEHASILEQAGLRPAKIDAEPAAIFRCLERRLRRCHDDATVNVILDIGAVASLVVVSCGRRMLFVKTIEIAGNRLNEAVAAQLNLSSQEAFDLRRRVAAAGDDADQKLRESVRDAVRGETDALCREIALCLRYCSVTFRGLRPNRIQISGGVAHDSLVTRLIAETLNTECVLAEPMSGIDLSNADLGDERRSGLSEWATCVGLALDAADDLAVEEAENVPDQLPA